MVTVLLEYTYLALSVVSYGHYYCFKSCLWLLYWSASILAMLNRLCYCSQTTKISPIFQEFCFLLFTSYYSKKCWQNQHSPTVELFDRYMGSGMSIFNLAVNLRLLICKYLTPWWFWVTTRLRLTVFYSMYTLSRSW